MAYISFSFQNSNDDQTFTVSDSIDTSRNPIFQGPINHNEWSPSIQCWAGGDGKGEVVVRGDKGPSLNQEIDKDGDTFSY